MARITYCLVLISAIFLVQVHSSSIGSNDPVLNKDLKTSNNTGQVNNATVKTLKSTQNNTLNSSLGSQSLAKPIEKPPTATSPVKPLTASTEKPFTSSTEKPISKPAEKPTTKPTEKSFIKTTENPVNVLDTVVKNTALKSNISKHDIDKLRQDIKDMVYSLASVEISILGYEKGVNSTVSLTKSLQKAVNATTTVTKDLKNLAKNSSLSTKNITQALFMAMEAYSQHLQTLATVSLHNLVNLTNQYLQKQPASSCKQNNMELLNALIDFEYKIITSKDYDKISKNFTSLDKNLSENDSKIFRKFLSYIRNSVELNVSNCTSPLVNGYVHTVIDNILFPEMPKTSQEALLITIENILREMFKGEASAVVFYWGDSEAGIAPPKEVIESLEKTISNDLGLNMPPVYEAQIIDVAIY